MEEEYSLKIELTEDIKFNFIKMCELKNLTNEEKGAFVREMMKQEGSTSQRSFARKYGLKYSTLHDWISNRQIKKYYNDKALVEKYFVVNKETGKPVRVHANAIRKCLKGNELDALLSRIVFVLSRNDYEVTDKTKRLINEVLIELEKVYLK